MPSTPRAARRRPHPKATASSATSSAAPTTRPRTDEDPAVERCATFIEGLDKLTGNEKVELLARLDMLTRVSRASARA